MNLCPFYDPHHKCGIVRENVFKDCLTELRLRELVTRERLERERNEAREAYESETQSTIDMTNKIMGLEAECHRAQCERDHWIEQANMWRGRHSELFMKLNPITEPIIGQNKLLENP